MSLPKLIQRVTDARVSRAVVAASLSITLAACSLPNETATKAAAGMSKPLSDGEILQVLKTLNTGEIGQAQVAMQRSNNPDVQQAAERIIDDHERANQNIAELAQSNNIPLEESPLSRGLEMQANELREELTDLRGTEFDCMYLDKQIELHTLAIDTVQGDLMPHAEMPPVRQTLERTTPSLERHRQMAQQSMQSMDQCNPS